LLTLKLLSSLVMATLGAGLLVAAGFAAPAKGGSPQTVDTGQKRGGTLRIDSRSDFDYVDPTLSYFSHSLQLQNAVQLKLLSFPDREGPAGGRIVPEAAAGFPQVSADGRTYTFTIRKGFRFSNGAPVTAANFRAALARALNPKMESPASSFLDDVRSFRTVGRYGLRVTLERPAPDFLARLTMPFFSAIPTNLPLVAEGVGAPIVSAGPYALKEWVRGRSAVVVRNPYWNNAKQPWKALGRPANVDRIVYTFGNSLDATFLRLRKNEADLGGTPPSAPSQLAEEFGINKGRFFVRRLMVQWYLGLNTNGALFKDNLKLRQAVNWAIDRPQLVRQHGFLAGGRTDQILPPGMPGFEDSKLYSLEGVNKASLAKATALARGRTRGGKVIFYAINSAPSPAIAQVVQYNLKKIGLDVEIKTFDRTVGHEKVGTRGEPFDIAHEAWSADYPDPSSFLNVLLDGRRIQATNNVNIAYFNDPAYNRKLDAASRKSGAERLHAYAALDADVMRTGAPWAPYLALNQRVFVSPSVGCFTYSSVYGTTNLAAVCKK
jgi:peptide/nickel transport system substrate-binding protein